MESAKNDIKTVAGRGRGAGRPAGSKAIREVKDAPRSRSVNRSSRAAEFADFSRAVIRELDPRGPLQTLVADQVVHSAWKLKQGIDGRAARDPLTKTDPDPAVDGAGKRARPVEIERASSALRVALESLDYLRARPVAASAVDRIEVVYEEILPNEWPVVPTFDLDEVADESATPLDDFPPWRDRLIYDFEVSDISPVVKGTWITVAHVISEIVDGSSWADILRSHPELIEEDIRTCVAYAMSEEGSAP